MGFPLCQGRWRPARVCAPLALCSPPSARAWLLLTYFPSICPRGCLLSLLLGLLLWHLSSRLCYERHQVGGLMPSSVRTVPTAGMEKGADGDTGWVHRQVASDEGEELVGRGSPRHLTTPPPARVNVKSELP